MTRVSIAVLLVAALGVDCDYPPDSDGVQRAQQEKILMEGTQAVGMPAIKNFRERRILKDILELRDQTTLATFTYIWSDYQGRLIFFCHSVGYGIPYATQYTSPQKWTWIGDGHSAVMPQADPNGLFSPAAAEGTWVLCFDEARETTRPVYVEPRIVTSPFPIGAEPPRRHVKN